MSLINNWFRKYFAKDRELEEKIQQEIQKRVLEESQRLQEQERKREEEQVQLEALAEVSELPRKEVERIARQVRVKYEKPDQSKLSRSRISSSKFLTRLRKLILPAIPVIIIVSAGLFLIGKEIGIKVRVRSVKEHSELLAAVGSGNKQMTEYLLDKGVPTELKGFASALMIAADKGDIPMVKLLMNRGADVTFKNNGGYTALSYADRKGNIPLMKLLGQAMSDASPPGSPIRQLWEKGIPFTEYSFVERAKQNDLESVKIFLAGGMDINAEGSDRETALMEAAERGHNEVVKLILAEGKPVSGLEKALIGAVREGHFEVVQTMIEGGADPNLRNFSVSPLFYSLPHLEITEYLLENGADINVTMGNNEYTTLFAVLSKWKPNIAEARRKEWVRFLLDHGADVNIRSLGGISTLDLARSWGDREVIRWLKEAGAEEIITEGRFLALVDSNDLETVKLFLEQGVNPNSLPEHVGRGATALVKAVRTNNYALVKLLLDFGADPNGKNEYGSTALMEAAYRRYTDLAGLLLEYGADVKAKNSRGKTAIDVAEEGYDEELTGLLRKAAAKE